jgi:hypothetical protein
MNNAFEQMREGVQWVLDNCTSYQVAKDLRINNRTINRYQNGTTETSKMALETAEKLYSYYLEELNKMDREELFSRALAALNKISVRHFEKGKPSIEVKYMKDFSLKPMTIYARAIKDVSLYADKFDGYDLTLWDRATNYIGSMDTTTFNDDPLSPKCLIYFSKEMTSLNTFKEDNK